MRKGKFLKFLAVLLLCGFCFSVFAQAEKTYEGGEAVLSNPEGGDGSSFEEAVVIKYIGDYAASIAQEYDYIDKKFGVMGEKCDITMQRIIAEGDKTYDVLTVKIFVSGEEKEVYFDITEPYNELVKQFQQKK